MNVFVLAFLILYVAGEPIFALCLYIFWLRKRNKLTKIDGKAMNWFGALYSNYLPKYAWWEVLSKYK